MLQAMLAESWIPVQEEPEEGQEPAEPPPSFDPASAEYGVRFMPACMEPCYCNKLTM